MKALIIDDERLAREELRGMLLEHPDVHVCGEAGAVTEALTLISRHQPDLLFLDIQMPGRTGFDLLETLPPPHPRVIFTTAYDEFAVRAFEANALDYLLKPIHPRRLAAALQKLTTGWRAPVDAAPAESDPRPVPLTEDDRVFVREGDRCWFVPVRSIFLLEAEGNYTRIRFENHRPALCRTLSSLEERLPQRMFLRANRSQMVNLNEIVAMEPWFSGSLKVRMKTGDEVEFSRRQAQLLRERLSL